MHGQLTGASLMSAPGEMKKNPVRMENSHD